MRVACENSFADDAGVQEGILPHPYPKNIITPTARSMVDRRLDVTESVSDEETKLDYWTGSCNNMEILLFGYRVLEMTIGSGSLDRVVG
jgi:hypothetical protein